MAEGEDAVIRRMQKYNHLRHTTHADAYGEMIKSWETLGVIEMAVSLTSGTQATANNVLTSSSTHVGVTDRKTVIPGDKLVKGDDVYMVDFAVNGSRKQLLYLKKETPKGV